MPVISSTRGIVPRHEGRQVRRAVGRLVAPFREGLDAEARMALPTASLPPTTPIDPTMLVASA
jgi:hypothetical protein